MRKLATLVGIVAIIVSMGPGGANASTDSVARLEAYNVNGITPGTPTWFMEVRPVDGGPTQPCVHDEMVGTPCFWDASTRGDRNGDSFVATRIEGVGASARALVVLNCVSPSGHFYTYAGMAETAIRLCSQGQEVMR